MKKYDDGKRKTSGKMFTEESCSSALDCIYYLIDDD